MVSTGIATEGGHDLQATIRVTGSQSLAALSRDLKAAGRNDLRKEMLREFRKIMKPALAAVRISARTRLPQRGGLANLVASDPRIKAMSSLSGRYAKVGITAGTAGKGRDFASLNRGLLRHPVYAKGDDRFEWTWVNQQIDPGWFTDPLERLEPTVQAACRRVMDNIIRDLAR